MKKIHLQGIGEKSAVPASELKPGDIILWNYGYKSRVLEIVKETKKSVVLKTQSCDSLAVCERRFLKSRLVAKK